MRRPDTPPPCSPSESPAPRPFLKWAGGKTQLVPSLLAHAPTHIETYYEPFLGGGALFFALMAAPERRPQRVVLNDLNEELITTYEVVRDHVQELAAQLSGIEREYLGSDAEKRQAIFYRVRAERPSTPIEVAARVIFLNKTCFNGLFRVNHRGEFNVPHGRYRAPHILDAATLAAASSALHGAELSRMDFALACADAGPDDFVYFDPPFQPLSETSSFTAYTAQDFAPADQVRLKRCIDDLTRRGVQVLLSNSPHPWIQGGYEFAGYIVEQVSARRAINARGDRRGPIAELVVTNPDYARARGRVRAHTAPEA